MFSAWKIYKGGGALSLSFEKPTIEDVGGKQIVTAGAIHLEMAPILDKEKKQYDWKNSVRFKLGANDIGTILAQKEFSLIHNYLIQSNPEDKSQEKTLNFSLAKSPGASYGFLGMSHLAEEKKYSVPITVGEHAVLLQILRQLLVPMLGLTL